MSTRGAFGVRIDGQDKVTYNHSDSYPSGLGEDILGVTEALLVDRPKFERMARALRPVDKSKLPSPEDINYLRPWTNLQVSEQSTQDWYCLLRNTQGDLEAVLEAGLYEDGIKFMGDSLFCEYAYIINLDEDVLEAYKGFQKEPSASRFEASRPESGYYAVKLMGVMPLNSLSPKALASIYGEDEEE